MSALMEKFAERRKKEIAAKAKKQHAMKRPGKNDSQKNMKSIPETHDAPYAAGSHKLDAIQRHKGFVKKKLAKKIDKEQHYRKMRLARGY